MKVKNRARLKVGKNLLQTTLLMYFQKVNSSNSVHTVSEKKLSTLQTLLTTILKNISVGRVQAATESLMKLNKD